MSNFYGQIYKITYPDDPHYYYGQTTYSLTDRLRGHIQMSGVNNYDINNWISQLENHDLVIIEQIDTATSQKELNNKELEIIGDLWFTDQYCLNMRPGGQGTPSGENHPNAKYSDELVTYLKNSEKTPKELSLEFGISQEYIRGLKKGKKRPSIKTKIIYNKSDRSGVNNPRSTFKEWYEIFYIRISSLKRSNDPYIPDRLLSSEELRPIYEEKFGYPIEVTKSNLCRLLRGSSWKDPNWDSVDRVYTGEPKGWEDWWEDELGHWSTS